jgi:hypothetical protein
MESVDDLGVGQSLSGTFGSSLTPAAGAVRAERVLLSRPRRSPSSRSSRARPETLRRVGANEGYFGERVAAVYDEHSASMFDPAVVGPAVDRLAELAGDGGALEFATGTGRIALPLVERGCA